MKQFVLKYYELLTDTYRSINLTRITNYDDFYTKQILDSIEPIHQSKTFEAGLAKFNLIIDVGFGGGFPILPLAFQLPNHQFIGIETRRKKVDVVSEIASSLQILNTKFLHERIENILIDLDAIITFKAVGKVYDFLSKINIKPNINVEVYFYKAKNFYELEQNQLTLAQEFWEIICEDEISIPGVDKRYLIGFKNKHKNVPRGTKDLVKVSSIQ
jgi:16S rRNA (guanine527-N7)-methyltransferase